jgi:hypothetical protein
MPDHNERSPTVGRGQASESVQAGNASETKPTKNEKQAPLSELGRSRDKIEVWIALLNLLDRLRARVGYALEDFEDVLAYDEELVAELTREVESFSRFAAHRYNRRRS